MDKLVLEANLRLELKGFLGDISGHIRYEDINVKPFGTFQNSDNVIDVIYNNFWLSRLNQFIKESEIPKKTINIFYSKNNSIIHNNGGVKTLRFETTPLLKAFDEWVSEANSKVDLCKDELYTNKDVAMARVFAFRQHDIECNHWYDKELGLPYSYHLQLVADVGAKFLHILPKKISNTCVNWLLPTRFG